MKPKEQKKARDWYETHGEEVSKLFKTILWGTSWTSESV